MTRVDAPWARTAPKMVYYSRGRLRREQKVPQAEEIIRSNQGISSHLHIKKAGLIKNLNRKGKSKNRDIFLPSQTAQPLFVSREKVNALQLRKAALTIKIAVADDSIGRK